MWSMRGTLYYLTLVSNSTWITVTNTLWEKKSVHETDNSETGSKEFINKIKNFYFILGVQQFLPV